MDKFKTILIKSMVLVINAALVLGAVFFIKNKQNQTQGAVDLTVNAQTGQATDQSNQMQTAGMQKRSAIQKAVPSSSMPAAPETSSSSPSSNKTTKRS